MLKKISLFLGADHGGIPLKEHLKAKLADHGVTVEDLGTHGSASTDYPDFAEKVARRVVETGDCGILVCGSGTGMAISANKIAGIRAANVWDVTSARLSKEHNNVNILCLGSRLLGADVAWEAVQAWMNAEFQGGRHQTRVNKISELEKGKKSIERFLNAKPIGN